jgi:hypothetical protein
LTFIPSTDRRRLIPAFGFTAERSWLDSRPRVQLTG